MRSECPCYTLNWFNCQKRHLAIFLLSTKSDGNWEVEFTIDSHIFPTVKVNLKKICWSLSERGKAYLSVRMWQVISRGYALEPQCSHSSVVGKPNSPISKCLSNNSRTVRWSFSSIDWQTKCLTTRHNAKTKKNLY